jgi:tRNA threonylcarbamoyladenosine biosynthesis protein TsaE
MPGELTVTTHSGPETERLGAGVAALLPRGAVIALYGELASGKTCFVRGMAAAFSEWPDQDGREGRGEGLEDQVRSPTFTLINEYGLNPRLYHIDLYRLAGPADVADLGCAELFDSDDVCAVEWAERAGPMLPPVRLDVHLEHGGGDTRRITLTDRGLLHDDWIEHIALLA